MQDVPIISSTHTPVVRNAWESPATGLAWVASTATVVTTGVYRFTRNPMYVGLTLVLAGWCVGLGTAVGLVVTVPLLVAYLTRFQIVPEERALARHFGEPFADYRARVRRWL